jgi:hypothetical protein
MWLNLPGQPQRPVLSKPSKWLATAMLPAKVLAHRNARCRRTRLLLASSSPMRLNLPG